MLGFNRARDPRAGKRANRRVLVNADFTGIATADVAVATDYTLVGYYTVPFGVIAAWGANDPTGGASVAGTPAYIRFDSTGGQIAGMIRLVVADPTRDNFARVIEEHSSRWSADTSDRTKAVLLPESLPLVQPQSRMEIWMKAATASTIDYDDADTLIRLPVTLYT